MTPLVVRSTTATAASSARAGPPPSAVTQARSSAVAASLPRVLVVDGIEVIEVVRRRLAAFVLLVVHERLPALIVRVSHEDVVVERRRLCLLHFVQDLGAAVDDVDDAGAGPPV